MFRCPGYNHRCISVVVTPSIYRCSRYNHQHNIYALITTIDILMFRVHTSIYRTMCLSGCLTCAMASALCLAYLPLCSFTCFFFPLFSLMSHNTKCLVLHHLTTLLHTILALSYNLLYICFTLSIIHVAY